MSLDDVSNTVGPQEEQAKLVNKPIFAHLVFTQEQTMILRPYYAFFTNNSKTVKQTLLRRATSTSLAESLIDRPIALWIGAMEDNILSVTAEFSLEKEEKVEEAHDITGNQEVHAKLTFTKEQENDLRQAFNLLDYNGEGKINAQDVRVAIKALGYEPTAEDLQRMINAVDKGASGKLSFENFQTLIMRKVMALDCDGDIMKSFRLFDVDDSGSISFESLKTVTEILGIYLTDEEIEEMMDDADKDYDGFISVHEFMKMIKSSVDIVTP